MTDFNSHLSGSSIGSPEESARFFMAGYFPSLLKEKCAICTFLNFFSPVSQRFSLTSWKVLFRTDSQHPLLETDRCKCTRSYGGLAFSFKMRQRRKGAFKNYVDKMRYVDGSSNVNVTKRAYICSKNVNQRQVGGQNRAKIGQRSF